MQKYRVILIVRHYDSKASNDVLDVLGFLGHDLVTNLTEIALDIKKRWDSTQVHGPSFNQSSLGNSVTHCPKSLFQKSKEKIAPLQPKHILEAFRIMNRKPGYFN